MRYSTFFAIVFLFFLSFCKNKMSSNSLNDSQPVDEATLTKSLDSLDIDTSSFLVTNFPDLVKEIIYKTNHRLFDYVLQSYVPEKNDDSLFSVLKLKQLALADSFSIDSSAEEVILRKNTFNKRQQIEYKKNKSELKILIVTQLWSDGKKYQLIWMKALPEKKDETVYDDF